MEFDMKPFRDFVFAATLFVGGIAYSNAWSAPVPFGYVKGADGCLHRNPLSVLQGLPRIPCTPQTIKGPPPVFSTATPSQVIAALDCDLAAAAKATKGKAPDLSKATVTGSLTFSFVTKNSAGASLSVAAIPVFSSASLTPSLDASRLTETTLSDVYSLKVDTAALAPCASSSTNNWLTSRVVLNAGDHSATNVTKLQTDVAFVVTKQGSAGLKLNIVPIAIGPQVSSSNVNTQKLSLTIDFSSRATPAQPSAKPGGGTVSNSAPSTGK
jgi:hypothetical protein